MSGVPTVASNFLLLIGGRTERIGEDYVLKVKVKDDLKNSLGIVHGGVIATMIDSVLGTNLYYKFHAKTSTLECNINFVKGVSCGELTAKARVVHKGPKTVIAECEVRDSDQELVAVGMVTSNVKLP